MMAKPYIPLPTVVVVQCSKQDQLEFAVGLYGPEFIAKLPPDIAKNIQYLVPGDFDYSTTYELESPPTYCDKNGIPWYIVAPGQIHNLDELGAFFGTTWLIEIGSTTFVGAAKALHPAMTATKEPTITIEIADYNGKGSPLWVEVFYSEAAKVFSPAPLLDLEQRRLSMLGDCSYYFS
jgi:hypothetical protein